MFTKHLMTALTLSAAAFAAAEASTPVRPFALAADLTAFRRDAAYRPEFVPNAGRLVVQQGRGGVVTLKLTENIPCDHFVCRPVLPIEELVTLPIVSDTTDALGIRLIVAREDRRPADGVFEELRIYSSNGPEAEPGPNGERLPIALVATRIEHEVILARHSGDQGRFFSEYEATMLSPVRPINPPRPESFFMYGAPRHQPNPTCDLGVRLTLSKIGRSATLENYVGGVCEIAVDPNPRSYELDFGRSNAGGATFHGRRVRDDGKVDTIVIRDFRGSVIDVAAPARVVLTETTAEGVETTLYSYDGN